MGTASLKRPFFPGYNDLTTMASPGGEAATASAASTGDLNQRLSFLKKRPRDPGQVVVFAHHEPLEVNVIDSSTGTGGLGSCGEGADKSSPSTQGGAGTTATASPRSLVATTASMATPPSHSPGFVDPDAIMTSNGGSDESSSSPSPDNKIEIEEQEENPEELLPSNKSIPLHQSLKTRAEN